MPKNPIIAEPDLDEEIAGPSIDDSLFDLPVATKVFEDPSMDPGSPQWNPRKYFSAQPKVIIVVKKNESDVLSDPSGEREIRVPVSINGFSLPNGVVKGVPTRVPKDFADMLVKIGAAYRYADLPDAL